MTESSSAGGPTATASPPRSFSPFSGFNSAPSISQSTTPQPSQQSHSAFAPPRQAAPDPFAGLGASFSSKPAMPSPAPKPAAPAAAADDDEWSFSSALPAETVPSKHEAVVSNTSVMIGMSAERPSASPNSMKLLFAFSNNTPQPVSELHFQLAVTKVGNHPLSLPC